MSRKDKWVWVGLLVAVVIVSLFVSRPMESESASSYNPGPMGTKVMYLLLQRLGYKTERIEKPLTEIPNDVKLILAISPISSLSEEERTALETWVKRGGTLMLKPTLFGSAKGWDELEEGPMGKGSIVHTYGVTNAMMASSLETALPPEMGLPRQMAYEEVQKIEKYVRPGDRILFDEYHLVFHKGDMPEASPQATAAIILLVVAALVACYSKGRRFGAVRDEPELSNLRPGFEYVSAVGQLYKRAHAPQVAAGSLCKTFRRKLCSKLGLPSDASIEDIIEQAESSDISKIAELTKLLQTCEPAASGEFMEESELLRVAREIHDMEEELGLERS
jgi:hypothetical protein